MLRPTYCLLLAMIIALPVHGQLITFGEWSLSAGGALHPAEVGGGMGLTAHGMAGIQYSIVAVEIGGGAIRLPLAEYKNRPFLETLGIDFPIGIALRFPAHKALIAIGCDASGMLNGFRNTLFQPHVDVLFPTRWRYWGVFVKGLTDVAGIAPGYIGLGAKMTLGQ